MLDNNIKLILKNLSLNLSEIINKNIFYYTHFSNCLNLLKFLYTQDINSNLNFEDLELNNEIFTKEFIMFNPNITVNLHFNITSLIDDYNRNTFNTDTSPVLSGNIDFLLSNYNIEYTPTSSFSKHHIYSKQLLFATQFIADDIYLLIIDGNHRITAKLNQAQDCYVKIVYIQPEDIINYMPSKFEQCFYLFLFEINNFSSFNINNLLHSLIFKHFKEEYLICSNTPIIPK
ncbi:hypothetical protein QJR26_18515 (plasmid) [Clostridium baratii]